MYSKRINQIPSSHYNSRKVQVTASWSWKLTTVAVSNFLHQNFKVCLVITFNAQLS